jgi:hypothetical protein
MNKRHVRYAGIAVLTIASVAFGALFAPALPGTESVFVGRTRSLKSIVPEEARVDDLFYGAAPDESWCSIVHRVNAFCWGRWYLQEGLSIVARHPRVLGDPNWRQTFKAAAIQFDTVGPYTGWVGGLCRMKDSREDWQRNKHLIRPCPEETRAINAEP